MRQGALSSSVGFRPFPEYPHGWICACTVPGPGSVGVLRNGLRETGWSHLQLCRPCLQSTPQSRVPLWTLHMSAVGLKSCAEVSVFLTVWKWARPQSPAFLWPPWGSFALKNHFYFLSLVPALSEGKWDNQQLEMRLWLLTWRCGPSYLCSLRFAFFGLRGPTCTRESAELGHVTLNLGLYVLAVVCVHSEVTRARLGNASVLVYRPNVSECPLTFKSEEPTLLETTW